VPVNVPAPFLDWEPTPLKVNAVPLLAKNVLPPASSVIALLEMIPPPAADAASVLRSKLSGPVPRLPALFIATTPPLNCATIAQMMQTPYTESKKISGNLWGSGLVLMRLMAVLEYAQQGV
jgi:hypothetical protein